MGSTTPFPICCCLRPFPSSLQPSGLCDQTSVGSFLTSAAHYTRFFYCNSVFLFPKMSPGAEEFQSNDALKVKLISGPFVEKRHFQFPFSDILVKRNNPDLHGQTDFLSRSPETPKLGLTPKSDRVHVAHDVVMTRLQRARRAHSSQARPRVAHLRYSTFTDARNRLLFFSLRQSCDLQSDLLAVGMIRERKDSGDEHQRQSGADEL